MLHRGNSIHLHQVSFVKQARASSAEVATGFAPERGLTGDPRAERALLTADRGNLHAPFAEVMALVANLCPAAALLTPCSGHTGMASGVRSAGERGCR